MAKICFQVVGCRLNQAEAERMAQGFILAGHEVVRDPGEADVRVVNTCTVTAEAGRRSRRTARQGRKGQQVIVTGCHSELYPEEFSSARLTVTNAAKHRLVDLALEQFGMDGFALGMDHRPTSRPALYPLVLDHTRAFVKIQDGCDRRCSFCLTTVARGASQCRAAEVILDEVRSLADQGCREAVLTGVHVGCYHDAGLDLGGLMGRLLERTHLSRLRLSSMEPWNFKHRWLSLWARHPGRLCRHLHMSLQSGSDSVLRRMRRGYTARSFEEKMVAIREAEPDMAITTDLIAGFPGETEAEHQETLQQLERLELAGAHVFSFSPRPGTEAAGMPGQVPAEVKRRRHAELKEMADRAALAYRRRWNGRIVEVLWENHAPGDTASGLTDTYLRVKGRFPGIQPNTLGRVKVSVLCDGGLEAQALSLP